GLDDARRDLRLDVCCDAARDRRRRREKIAGPAGELAEAQSRRWREVEAEVLTPRRLAAGVPDLVLAARTLEVARQRNPADGVVRAELELDVVADVAANLRDPLPRPVVRVIGEPAPSVLASVVHEGAEARRKR